MHGHLRLTFKAKALADINAIVITLNNGGIGTPICLDNINIRTFGDEDWQEISFETYNPSSEDAFFQISFSTYTDKKGVLLDDIKIEQYPDWAPATTDIAFRNFSPTGFEAGWMPVENASEYILTVYEETQTGTSPETRTLDFNDIAAGSTATLPDGWTVFTYPGKGEYAQEGADGTMAFVMGRENEYIETPSNGNRITGMSFDVKNLKGDDPKTWGYQVQFLGWDGRNWVNFGGFSTLNMDDGATAHIDMQEMVEENNNDPYSSGTSVFAGAYTKVRIIGESLNSTARLSIDNLSVTYEPASETSPVKTLRTENNIASVDGLDLNSHRYYAAVQAVVGGVESEEYRAEAFGIWAPTIANPEINPNYYVAAWEPVPVAVAYLATNYTCLRAEKDIDDFTLMTEDFANATGDYSTDPAKPTKLGNTEELASLDYFTSTTGWHGAGNTVIEGAIGCQKAWIPGQYGIQTSASYSLNNGDRTFTVSGRVYIAEGKQLVIASTNCDGLTEAAPATGWMDFSVQMLEGAKHDQLTFYSYDGAAFLIDDIKVTQNIKANDLVLNALENHEVIDETNTLFDLPTHQDGQLFAYDVLAGRQYFSQTAVSDYSATRVIDTNETGLQDTPATSAIAVAGKSGAIAVTTLQAATVEVYSIAGRLIATRSLNAGNADIPCAKGIYVVRAGSKSFKVTVR